MKRLGNVHILMYSHDTFGLGHLRRCRAIAHSLVENYKGVSILTGFLRGTFARRSPLTMSCSVTFEQSYGGVDGDSASSTEIYAILSAISEQPLRQDVAVTGSVDQRGNVQAIGGVNEKIEGFFRVCSERNLKGQMKLKKVIMKNGTFIRGSKV